MTRRVPLGRAASDDVPDRDGRARRQHARARVMWRNGGVRCRFRDCLIPGPEPTGLRLGTFHDLGATERNRAFGTARAKTRLGTHDSGRPGHRMPTGCVCVTPVAVAPYDSDDEALEAYEREVSSRTSAWEPAMPKPPAAERTRAGSSFSSRPKPRARA